MFFNHKKRKHQSQQQQHQQQNHLQHHKYLDGDDQNEDYHMNHKCNSSLGLSKNSEKQIHYIRNEKKYDVFEIEDEYLQQFIESNKCNDYYISMNSNQLDKISSDKKDASFIPLRYFYEMMKPFEVKVQNILTQIESHNLLNTQEFSFIISSLTHHSIVQHLHRENLIFSSKYFKRYIRIFTALKSFLHECEIFYGYQNTEQQIQLQQQQQSQNQQNQQQQQQQIKIGDYQESRNKIVNLLDDIIPYMNVLYLNTLRNLGNYQNGKTQMRQLDLFQEEFAKNMNEIQLTSDTIILFLRMWMGMINTDLNQFLVLSNNLLLDMAIIKSNLQEFIEIHRDSAKEVFIVSSLNDPECQLFCKLSRNNMVPQMNNTRQDNYNNNIKLNHEQSSQQQQNNNLQNNYEQGLQQSPFDMYYQQQNEYSNEERETSQNKKQMMKQMMKNMMDDEDMEVESTELTSEYIFDSVRDHLYSLYNLDDNSEIFYFDENYVQVNTIMEFQKTKLIKIIINKSTYTYYNQNNYINNYPVLNNSPINPLANLPIDVSQNIPNTNNYQNINQNQQTIMYNSNNNGDQAYGNMMMANYYNDQNNTNLGIQMQVQQRPLIIGVSGSTRSGKGTLCAHLQILYGAKYICQDSYFNYPLIQSVLQGNAECKEAILWDQLKQDIQNVVQQNKYKVLILDGFQLFSDDSITNICDVQIFLDIPTEEIYQRRMVTKPVKESYFWKYLIQEYNKYRSKCLQDNRITIFQSNQDQFINYFLTLQLIQLKLNTTTATNTISNHNIII